MRSLLEKKPWVVLLSILALGALTVLSVSMGNVSFGGSQPIGREEAEPLGLPFQLEPGPAGEESPPTQVALWVALIVLISLISVLLSPEARRRLFRFLVRTAVIVWALSILFEQNPGIFGFLDLALKANLSELDNPGANAGVPPPVFTPPRETPVLSYVVSLLVVLGVIFAAWRAYRAWQAMNQRPAMPLQELARIARSSLRDLSDGRETSDVIMNCYFRMGDVVADKRNLQRGAGMTPAEFAARLEEAGLPGDAVRRLTRLFEGVRYGERKAGPEEVNEAVACLTSILQYCEEPV